MSLWVDLRNLQENLQDSQTRLECLKECHLQEYPLVPLPDFLFPLQKALQESLEQLAPLQDQVKRDHLKAQAQLAQKALSESVPEAGSLAEAEAKEKAQAEARAAALAKGWGWVLGVEKG